MIPKFRSEGPVRVNQGVGEGRGGVFQGGLGTEKHEHNPRGKSKHSVFRDGKKFSMTESRELEFGGGKVCHLRRYLGPDHEGP